MLEFLASSPTILVGFITDPEETVGWAHSSKYGGHPVQLYRVKVNVENVIQGRVPSSEITVYFFGITGNFTGLQPMGFGIGYRYIFYLRQEADQWRTVCDDYAYCADRVRTGRHTTFKRKPKRPISEDILGILYRRGEGISDGEMVDLLAAPDYYAYRWKDSQDEVFTNLLQRIAKEDTPPVRAAACEQLRHLSKPCEMRIYLERS